MSVNPALLANPAFHNKVRENLPSVGGTVRALSAGTGIDKLMDLANPDVPITGGDLLLGTLAGGRGKVVKNLARKLNKNVKMGFDNPGGDWLKKHQNKTREQGRAFLDGEDFPAGDRPFERFGKVTAYVREGEDITVPVEKLAKVRGLRNEQGRVREDSAEWMKKNLKIENNQTKTPKYVRTSEEEADRLLALRDKGEWSGNPYWKRVPGEHEKHLPFIQVDQEGRAWVSEGNHRIMEAMRRGQKNLDIEIKWFNGGEQVKGPWSPEALLAR